MREGEVVPLSPLAWPQLQAIVEAARAAGGANASLEKLAAAAPPAAVGDDGDAAQPEGEGEQAKEEKA